MLFQTPEFALLLILTLVLFYGPLSRLRPAVLAATSVVFYCWSGIPDLAVLLLVFSGTYVLSKRVQPGGSRAPVIAAIVLLLLNLGYFKYASFIYTSLAHLAAV